MLTELGSRLWVVQAPLRFLGVQVGRTWRSSGFAPAACWSTLPRRSAASYAAELTAGLTGRHEPSVFGVRPAGPPGGSRSARLM